jgi:hypothetical protein
MATKFNNFNIIPAAIGVVTAGFVFVRDVISRARQKAIKSDAFADMRKEYQERLAAVKESTPNIEERHRELQSIEREFTRRRDGKLHELGLTQLPKAWNSLDGKQREKSVIFSAISGVMVGGLSYAVGQAMRANNKPGKSGKGDDTNWVDSGAGWGGGSSVSHHDGGIGHVFGDCGGGGFGGGDGGGCGL